ncbi:MAG: hypothetical protein HC817_00240 [Saprospiraceae bacterium]|nr:hypothetical protein [Saprospiraceae bacterium]
MLNKLSTPYQRTIVVKLNYVLPKGKVLSSIPPQYALVTMRNSGWDWLTNASEKIDVQLAVDSFQSLSVRNLMAQNFETDVQNVSVEQISVQIEDAETKVVAVEPIIDLGFASGFAQSGAVEMTPSVVKVSGAKNLLEKLIGIKTDSIKGVNLASALKGKIKLLQHPILQYDISEVAVKIPVEQYTEKSFFVPIVLKNAPPNLKIFPNKIKIDCSVALSRYESISPQNFLAEVDLKNASTDKNNIAAILLIKQPDFVWHVKYAPKTVEFFIEK